MTRHRSARFSQRFLPSRRCRQQGSALVSALVAFLAVAISLLAATRMQSVFRQGTDFARRQSEALHLAQADIERLRAFTDLGSGASGYDAIVDFVGEVTPLGSPTVYTLSRRVQVLGPTDARKVDVAVSWTDPRGTAQQVRLATLIARQDPAYGGALTQPAHGRPVARVLGRDARVPLSARSLGNGSSVFKPDPAGTRAWRLDDATGAVVAACTTPAGKPMHELVSGDLEGCQPLHGLLVSGYVRFSSGVTPSAATPDDAPLAFDVTATADGPQAMAPACAAAAPAAASGERWVAYTCVIAPAGGASWSGRIDLVPRGWSIGTAADSHRVCRYTADHDAGGTADRPAGHPARHVGVTASLAHQNFLVIDGAQACPGGSPTRVDGRGADNRSDLSTAQHQP